MFGLMGMCGWVGVDGCVGVDPREGVSVWVGVSSGECVCPRDAASAETSCVCGVKS